MASPKKGARRRGATLLFWDEAGFSQRPSVRATWAPRGQTPVLRTHFNWERLSSIGMLLYSPARGRVRLLFSLQKGSVNTERVIGALRDLRRHVRGKVLLVWDGLGGHISTATRTYLATQRHWLQVVRLPSYAPELNPVEYLWADLSATEMANFAPDTLEELAAGVHRGIDRARGHQDLLISFLKHSGLFPEL